VSRRVVALCIIDVCVRREIAAFVVGAVATVLASTTVFASTTVVVAVAGATSEGRDADRAAG